MARPINNFMLGFVGSLVAVGLIVAIIGTTHGVPTWAGAVAGLLMFAVVGLSAYRTSRLAARIRDAMRGKGAMTATDVSAALDDTIPRPRVIAALARLRSRGEVTRDEIPADQRGDAPDTHRYTAA
jgi:hypothetical protein